jgi:hypothetical protein
MKATWQPHEKHGRLTTRSDLPDTVYAFPKQRKEALTDAEHVRKAVARFDQVIDVSDTDRALAFANIEKTARHYNVDLSESSWHDLGVHPQRNRKEAATKGVDELVAQIHPRMPVILPEQHHAAWLGETEDGNLKELLVPYPADQMRMWEISSRINSPKNDDPSLWEPLHAEPADTKIEALELLLNKDAEQIR